MLLESMLPTLLKCFGVIFLGYLAGCRKWIKDNEVKGLTVFSMHFTLPAAIFLNLATLELQNVDWNFVVAILIGKAIVFFVVAAISMLTQKQANMAKSGLLAIFCTQGNDFALAYPLVSALFGGTHPLYPSYIYILAPISLIVLNPMGFLLMEGILKNPIVSVTILGVLWNAAFGSYIPLTLEKTLKVLSSAFAASVLFLLGIAVSRKITFLDKSDVLQSCALILVKMFLLPIVLFVCVRFWCRHNEFVEDLSFYGFLYGVAPTGPIVLLFAAQYSVPHKMLASTLVICTMLFGPLVYIFVRLFSLTETTSTSVTDYLKATAACINTLGLIFLVMMLTSFSVNGSWRKPFHFFISFLFLSQGVLSLGMVLWTNLPFERKSWMIPAVVCISNIGSFMYMFSASLFSSAILMQLFLGRTIRKRTTVYVIVVAVGVFSTCVIVKVIHRFCNDPTEINLSSIGWLEGPKEAITSSVCQGICIFVISCALVIHCKNHNSQNVPSGSKHITTEIKEMTDNNTQSHRKLSINSTKSFRRESFFDLTNEEVQELASRRRSRDEELNSRRVSREEESTSRSVSRISVEESLSRRASTEENPSDVQSIISATQDTKWHLQPVFRRTETTISMNELLPDVETQSTDCKSDSNDLEDMKPFQLSVLLLLLNCSMITGVLLNLHYLHMSRPLGLCLALEFLNTVIFHTQGLATFAMFGSASNFSFSVVFERIKRIYPRKEETHDVGEIDTFDIKHVCDHFLIFHSQHCARELSQDASGFSLPNALRILCHDSKGYFRPLHIFGAKDFHDFPSKSKVWTRIESTKEPFKSSPFKLTHLLHQKNNHQSAFRGHDIVKWLVSKGIVENRKRGIAYGQILFISEILQPVQLSERFCEGLYKIDLNHRLPSETEDC